MAYHGHNKKASFATTAKPVGVITRGTTGTNRLRRCDRWMMHTPEVLAALSRSRTPLAIDVGYGASHTTTCEWARWLRTAAPHVRVLGLEVDPSRVLPPRQGVEFALGGFELAGHTPHVVRAFNVLRQYDVSQVDNAWATVCARLSPGGVFVEGTCDEIGRRACWILLNHDGPQTLTLAWSPWHTDAPSQLAERLPKALIHRNVPGDPVHHLLTQLDEAWERAAGYAPFGPRARWFEARRLLREQNLPMVPQRKLLRDNLITVPWRLVDAP